jgi:hypothetical protein
MESRAIIYRRERATWVECFTHEIAVNQDKVYKRNASGIPDDMAQADLWKNTPLGRGSLEKIIARLAPAQVQVNSLSLPV